MPQVLAVTHAYRFKFRLTILLMIFVNYGGGGYVYMEHAPWFGLTIADIIFPSFVFIMGLSISLSIKSHLSLKKDFLLLSLRIMKRSAKLLILGIILNTDYTDLSKLRIPGVLQRFAISYLVVALVHLMTVARTQKYMRSHEEPSFIQVISIFIPEVLIYIKILMVYVYFTFLYNYSDECPKGYQGPGGLHDDHRYENCTGGAANYLDRVIFGDDHVYQNAASKKMYRHELPHDPEGFLGTFTSILLAEMGLISGRILLKFRSHSKRIFHWIFLSVSLGIAAYLFHYMNWIPVVKNLWSLSFVAGTTSLSLIFLVVFYILIDMTKIWPEGIPLNYPGSNAILLYLGHMIFNRYFPIYFRVDESSHSWLLFRVSWATTLWLLVSVYLFKRKIFLVV